MYGASVTTFGLDTGGRVFSPAPPPLPLQALLDLAARLPVPCAATAPPPRTPQPPPPLQPPAPSRLVTVTPPLGALGIGSLLPPHLAGAYGCSAVVATLLPSGSLAQMRVRLPCGIAAIGALDVRALPVGEVLAALAASTAATLGLVQLVEAALVERLLAAAPVAEAILLYLGQGGLGALSAASRSTQHAVALAAAQALWAQRPSGAQLRRRTPPYLVPGRSLERWAARFPASRVLAVDPRDAGYRQLPKFNGLQPESRSWNDLCRSVLGALPQLQHLEVLSLRFCSLGRDANDCFLLLVKGLQAASGALRELDLRYNCLGPRHGTDHGSDAPRTRPPPRDDGLEILGALSQALACGAPRLQVLNVGCNPLGGEGLGALLGPLARQPSARSLRELRACWVELRGDSCGALAAALPSFSGLRLLALGQNRGLGDAGCAALLPGVRGVAGLEAMWLNECGLHKGEGLAAAMPALPHLRALWLHGNGLGDCEKAGSGAWLLKQAAQRLTCRRALDLQV
jgi:hypothetical protein